ncbi:MAG TPA: hypothetical protein VGX23_37090 [Actinocrinis sp.]|nr:hypothetical protein [Actinocrinis sp.]
MFIDSLRRHSLPTAAAVSVACLALASGCSSSAKSTGTAGSTGSASVTGPAGSTDSAGSTGATGGASRPAAAGAPTSAAAAAGGGSGKLTAACPSAAVVTTDLGSNFQEPTQQGSDGSLLCTYSDAADDNLVIIFAPLPSGTTGALKLAMDSQAQAQNVPDNPVPGLGDAAFAFTMNDGSTNPDKVNTTTLAVLVGSEDVDITATAPVAKVEALARSIIGG